MLKFFQFIFATALFIFCYTALASGHPTWLVLDMANLSRLPKHFRTSLDPLPSNINKVGLAKLNIAGGAQFSTLALQQITSHLPTDHFTIIDLREESHGFLNGNAISWFGFQNADNAGKTLEQIEQDQANKLQQLATEKNVTVYTILKKNKQGEIIQTQANLFPVINVTSEAEIAAKENLAYYRISVRDFYPPTPEAVDQFIQIVRQLPAREWIYFHCRAGVGRTTTFMIMYDMMRNAKRVSFDAILARQEALGGKDMFHFPAQDSFKYSMSVERLQFLKDFYQYTRKNRDHFKTSWSQYLNKIKK